MTSEKSAYPKRDDTDLTLSYSIRTKLQSAKIAKTIWLAMIKRFDFIVKT